ncbi:MAG: hypothetical protein J5542_03405 [Bacteroidales bacterium]|nr:hypothetical protein [Bacteroidales bacterium]
MKKNFLLIACVIALVLGFSSCGGNKSPESNVQEEVLRHDSESKMIPTSKIELKGEHSDLINIPVDSVEIILEFDGLDNEDRYWVKVDMPVENTKTWSQFCAENKKNKGPNYEPKFVYDGVGAYFCDADGNKINSDISVYHYDMEDVIASESIKSKEMRVHSQTVGYDKTKKLFDKISSIVIQGITLESEESDNGGYEIADNDGDNDWDAILDDYEKYVDDYVALYKKAMNGDMDALSEYASVLEDAQNLSNKLAKGQGSMTSAQVSRYTKITQKMANAMK